MVSKRKVEHYFRDLDKGVIMGRFTNKKLYLDKYLVRLEIIEVDKNESGDTSSNMENKNEAFNRGDRRLWNGRRINTGIFLDLRNIFDRVGHQEKSDSPVCILFHGAPGTGKSTLCQKIAYDLKKDDSMWPQFKTIKCIQLRSLESDDHMLEILATNLESTANDVLYILDGWDEVQNWLLEEKFITVNKLLLQTNSSIEEKRNNIINVVLDYFIKPRGGCNSKSFILTTRSNVKLSFSTFDKVFEIRGFSNLNTAQYVRLVLHEDKKEHMENDIMEYLNSSAVSDLATIPLLLDAFLYTWNDIRRIKKSHITMSKLYVILVFNLWRKYFADIRMNILETLDLDLVSVSLENDSPARKQCRILCDFGNKFLKEGTLNFRFPADLRLSRYPFLNGIDTNADDDPNNQLYEFTHLTLLEFFAALELIQWDEIDFEKFVIDNKFNMSYRIVFRFVAGLMNMFVERYKEKENAKILWKKRLDKYFDYLEGDPVDLTGYYGFELLLDCINECESNLQSNRLRSMCQEIWYYYSCEYFDRSVHIPSSLVEIAISDFTMSPFSKCNLKGFSDAVVTAILANETLSSCTKLQLLCKQSTFSEFSLQEIKRLLKAKAYDCENTYERFLSRHVPLPVVREMIHFFNNNNEIETGSDYYWTIVRFFSHVQNINATQAKELLNELFVSLKYRRMEQFSEIVIQLVYCNKIKIEVFSVLRNIYDFVLVMPTAMEYVLERAKLHECELYARVLFVLILFRIYNDKIAKHFIFIVQHSLDAKLRLEAFKYLGNWSLPPNRKITVEVQRLMIQYMVRGESYDSNFKWDKECSKRICENIIAFLFFDIMRNEFESSEIDEFSEYLNSEYNRRPRDNSLVIYQKCIQNDRLKYAKVPLATFSDMFNDVRVVEIFNSAADCRNYDDIAIMIEAILTSSSLSEKFPFETLSDRQKKIFKNFVCHFLLALFELYDKCVQSDTCDYDISNTVFKKMGCKMSVMDVGDAWIVRGDFYDTALDALVYAEDDSLTRAAIRVAANPRKIGQGFSSSKRVQDIINDNNRTLEDETELTKFDVAEQKLKKLNKHELTDLIRDMSERYPNLPLYIKDGDLWVAFEKYGRKIEPREIQQISHLFNTETFSKYGNRQDTICRGFRLNLFKSSWNENWTAFAWEVGKGVQHSDVTTWQERLTAAKQKISSLKNLDSQTTVIVQKFIACPTEKLNVHTEFQFRDILNGCYHPIHLDLSSSKISDEQVYDISVFLRFAEVHSLVLSNNRITQKGFGSLMRAIRPNCTVKYLLLDRNFIQLDDTYLTEILLKDKSHLEMSKCLVVDLSFNFINVDLCKLLEPSEGIVRTDAGVVYIEKFGCRLIYDRPANEQLKFRSTIFELENDILNDLNKDKLKLEGPDRVYDKHFVNHERACVAYVEQRREYLPYSSHVVLLIEYLRNGQRVLVVGELFPDKETWNCIVTAPEVNAKRFKDILQFSKPARIGYFEHHLVLQMLDRIKKSADSVGQKRYGLDKTQEGIQLNCVDWANYMLLPLQGSKIAELHVPSLFSLYYFIERHKIDFIVVLISLLGLFGIWKIICYIFT